MSQCNKYNCLPRNMLNHAGNSYIPRWKQLCHPPDTVISGSRSNGAVAKQSKQSSGIWKQNLESTSSVFHFIWLCFYFKMSHNIYHMYVFSGGYTRISAPRWHESPGALCHPMLKAESASAFVLPRDWYSVISPSKSCDICIIVSLERK